MGTISEDRFITPTIETARITNVNLTDWSVDAISEHGGKLFFDIQVMSPYFHYMNGEGIYVMPEIGALAWLCKPSNGRFSEAFIMGFQAPFDEDDVSYRCNRQNLNPGDIMLRTRDENFIVLRRGGVVQIGATPTAQRIYVPIRNFIRDFCENYQLSTLGGELTWIVDRDDQTSTGDAPVKLSILVRDLANDPKHIAELTIGSHGEDETAKLELRIFSDGTDAREEMVNLAITKEGDVMWNMERGWTVSAKNSIFFEAREGDVTVKALEGKMHHESAQDMSYKTEADFKGEVAGDSTENVRGTKVIEAPLTKIGSNAAAEQGVLGNRLDSLLKQILTMIATLGATPVVAPGPGITINPGVATNAGTAQGTVALILASKMTLE